MTDIEGELISLGFDILKGWRSCRLSSPLPDQKSVYNWLNTTDGGRYWIGVISIYFEREEDMILFQLTWY